MPCVPRPQLAVGLIGGYFIPTVYTIARLAHLWLTHTKRIRMRDAYGLTGAGRCWPLTRESAYDGGGAGAAAPPRPRCSSLA